MTQSDPTSRRPKLWTALAATAVAGASAVTISLPPTAAAEPVPPPPPVPATAPPAPAAPPPPPPAAPEAPAPAAAPAPGEPVPPPPAAAPDPAAPPAAPADPNAPAPAPAPGPVDPNAAAPAAAPPAIESGRVENAAGGFSYILPSGWEAADASRLSYGQALLLKQTGPAPLPGQPAPTATDTSILLGRLDMKLFAGAEPDNAKAAVRLASDMGEFFMPFAGTRINQQTAGLQAGDMGGSASSYDVKFTETAKPNGQIWAGVVGTPGSGGSDPGNRWFVVWLGTANEPVDTAAAKALAESIRPYSPPPPPAAPAPDPNAPAAPPPPDPNAPAAPPPPDPNAPAAPPPPDPNAAAAPPPPPGDPVEVPVPVATPAPEMMPPA